MYKYSEIKKIHLEVTQNCQANCPMCDRNQNGGAVNHHINLDELTLEDCKRIFEPKFISQLESMYMCGNLGDPIVARDTLEIFRYFRENNSNMWLSMNTNAGARDSEWWSELAKIFGNSGYVIFSVDGLEDTNHLYRQGVSWSKVENSMKSFIAAGGKARWDFIVFDHNQHQVDKARRISEEWGFEKFIVKKTGRFVNSVTDKKDDHQAVNRNGEQTIILKKPISKYINNSLKKQDNILEKYGSMDEYYDTAKISCKVKNQRDLFISAEGLALPCCWTAGRMYKWWIPNPMETEQIWDYINDVGGKEALNAKNGLKNVFDTGIFDHIERSWSIEGCDNGKLKICAMKCGTEFDPFGDQFK